MEQTFATQTKTDHRSRPLGNLHADAVADLSNALLPLLADVFTLYLKAKNFHWHISGRHFRDYHLLLDEQVEQIFAMTDDIAERARKIGGITLRSVSEISKHQRLKDNNQESVGALAMRVELCTDNRELATFLRSTHQVSESYGDVATASLIENWIDETDRRIWFLAETTKEL